MSRSWHMNRSWGVQAIPEPTEVKVILWTAGLVSGSSRVLIVWLAQKSADTAFLQFLTHPAHRCKHSHCLCGIQRQEFPLPNPLICLLEYKSKTDFWSALHLTLHYFQSVLFLPHHKCGALIALLQGASAPPHPNPSAREVAPRNLQQTPSLSSLKLPLLVCFCDFAITIVEFDCPHWRLTTCTSFLSRNRQNAANCVSLC